MARIETKRIEDLIPDPNNVNKHTQKGHGLVENSIRRRGVGRGILAAGKNTDKPVIMAGNLTHEKARDAGIEEVVFVHTTGNQLVVTVRDDLDPASAEAIALGIEDNESGKQSYNPDIDLLAQLAAGDNGVLSELKKQDKQFGDMLSRMGLKEDDGADAEPQIDRAAELQEKWKTATGQLWTLGKHRLLIGDCTVRENVERLMGGEKTRLTLTDPPYDFDTDGGGILKAEGTMQKIKDAGINEFDPSTLIKESETSVYFCNKTLIPFYIDLAKLWRVSWDLAVSHKPFHAANWQGHLATDLEYILVIGKQSPYTGQSPNIYSKLWTGQKEDADEKIIKWAKPLGLIEKFIKLFSQVGDAIYEPFAGSGTTIIAAQNLSRRCCAMEISPNYGAVILERFHTAFPDEEIRLDTVENQ